MIIYEELKKIAEINQQRTELANVLCEKMDLDGLHIENAELINGCVAENGHLYDRDGNQLDNCGLVDNEYYCNQSKGFLDDDFHGVLYYATDKEGTFIRVPFSTY